MKCHVDGDLVPEDRAVSAADRGFRYGDAAVETLRARAGEPFRWADHRRRLLESCEALGIVPPDDLYERVRTTLGANDLTDALVRISITRGDGGGLTPPVESEPTVVVTTEPRTSTGGSTDSPSEPVRLQTVKTRPIPDRAIPTRANTHCRLDRVLARRELVADADEALILNDAGYIVGGAGSALFFVDDDAIRTPGLDGRSPRVLRSVVAEIADDEGFPAAEGEYTPDEIRGADEAFLANARWGIRPVGAVDGIELSAGPVTALLRRLLETRIERECSE